MGKKKKIPRQSIAQNSKVVNNSVPMNVDGNIVFDLSFDGLYYSVEHKYKNGDFTNYLESAHDFVEKFKVMRKLITDFSRRKFTDILKLPHCHALEKERAVLAEKCIEKARLAANSAVSNNFDKQVLDGERLYQLGQEKGIRLIGIYDSNKGIFYVMMIDYHHRIYYDQKKNRVGKNFKYCPMTSK